MTDNEQSFLTMGQVAGLRFGHFPNIEAFCWISRDDHPTHAFPRRDNVEGLAESLAEKYFDLFPIMASTFEAVLTDRPELREHYDAAKAAWEASQ